MKKILIAAPISQTFKKWLLDNNFELIPFPSPTSQNENFEGIITSNKLVLDETLLKTFSSLKWIARLGSGMEIIDTNYCNLHGIKYYNSPNGIANSVAEHTMGMVLSLLHQIPLSTQSIKKGKWAREKHRGVELSGKTVGIIGFGHTGKALAKKLSVFTKNILVYDKYHSNFQEEYIKESNIEDIQRHADIISFHVPLNDETKNYYNQEFCLKMQKEHILINTSRGSIAPTSVIIEGLMNGKIKGACLDVLEEEKNINLHLENKNSSIYKLLKQNVILTPHIAGYSFDAIENMSLELLEHLKKIIK